MKKLFLCMEYLFTLNAKVEKLLKWRKEIMATIQDLKDAALAEHEEVKTKVDALEAQVLALQNNGTGGATPEQLDEVLAAIKNIFTPDAPVINTPPGQPAEPIVLNTPPVVAEPSTPAAPVVGVQPTA